MDSEFLAAIGDGLDEVAALVGETFTIGAAPVVGIFSGAEYSVEQTVTGGAQEKIHGTLIISRRKYPDAAPKEQAIITDADGKRYRIGQLTTDAASWTLTLTHPNARTTTR